LRLSARPQDGNSLLLKRWEACGASCGGTNLELHELNWTLTSAPHSFWSPRTEGRNAGVQGLEIAGKTSTKFHFRAESGFSGPPSANEIARENMNPAILPVDVASANREELKSFLQDQKRDVDTAADGESAIGCCLHMQPDLVVLLNPSPDRWGFPSGREA
jgi:hypothetical protein